MENKVSIIVPAFNAEAYIETFIKSICAQSFKDWELIIVDDGSKDNTYSIIMKYAESDNRIIVKQRDREPKGSVTCRNIGQLLSTGKYIIHFDADDVIEPWCLEQRVSFMEKNPELDYATFKGASVLEDETGNLVHEGRYWGINPHDDVLECFLNVNYPYSVWNNIYKSSVFKNILWDERVKIYTDFSYIVPILIEQKKHAFCENGKIDYLYRVNIPNAMTSNFIADEKYESTKYLFTKTMLQLNGLPKRKEYIAAFKRYYLLQFERLLVSGSIAQLKDYIIFYRQYYSDSWKLKVISCVLKSDIMKGRKENFRRKVRLLLYSICIPKEFFKWLRERIQK